MPAFASVPRKSDNLIGMKKSAKHKFFAWTIGLSAAVLWFLGTSIVHAQLPWTYEMDCGTPTFGSTFGCKIVSYDRNGKVVSSKQATNLQIANYGNFELSCKRPSVSSSKREISVPPYDACLRLGGRCRHFTITAPVKTSKKISPDVRLASFFRTALAESEYGNCSEEEYYDIMYTEDGSLQTSTAHCKELTDRCGLTCGDAAGGSTIQKTIEVCYDGPTPTPSASASPSIFPSSSPTSCPEDSIMNCSHPGGTCTCEAILPSETPFPSTTPTIAPTFSPEPEPTEEPSKSIIDAIFGSDSNDSSGSGIIKSTIAKILLNPTVKKVAETVSSQNVAKVASVAIPVVAAIPAIPVAAASPAAAGLSNLSSNFFGMFFWKRKRDQHFVKATDSLTGKGIGDVVVLVRTPDGKTRATWTTDKRTGNTGDLLPSGKYEFVAQKKGWKFPSSEEPQFILESGDTVYRSGFIEINNKKEEKS